MDKTLLEVLSFLRKRMFFYDGLITILVLIGAFYSWFAQTIGARLLNLASACGFTSEGKLANFCFLFGFIAVELAGFIFWRHHRHVLKFRKDELGILFAPDFDEEVEKEVNRLFVHLRQELKSHEIGNRFSLKRLPLNLSISSASDAIALLKHSRSAVAVWGPLEQQSSDKGRTTGFSKFSMTFIHRPNKLSMSFYQTLAMSLVGRQFQCRDQFITDRNIVARDIGLVVRNALGVKLLLDDKFPEAVKILGAASC